MFLIDIDKVNAQVGIGEALVNTALGMGTVFIVLILISVIIFLLKYVPKLFEKKKAADTIPAISKEEVVAPVVKPVDDSKDTQMIAVIMAAIASQIEEETKVFVPADSLVIRSIKKRTLN